MFMQNFIKLSAADELSC